ncbi:hypothetical protein B566_EDAN014473 [Ephemera danica]|nr:hypothetical protein B566_EDAN014473 [Ephemera danica]
MSLRRSTSPPTRRGLNLVLNRSRSSVDTWAANNASSPTRSPKPLLPFCTSPSHLEDITLELDPSDTNSPYSDTLQSPAMPAGSRSMCGRTAKEYEEQVRVLKKDNFNLKLRIYFLEERMSSVGRQGANNDDVENKLIELKVELESLKHDMKNKQVLLAQAGKAIELMEEQHAQELNKLKQELQELQVQTRASKTASSLPSYLQQRSIPLDNSMQLYVDAFSLRPSILMPPPIAPGSMIDGQGDARLSSQESTENTLESLEQQQQIAELTQQLQQCMAELEACRERECNLSEALDSKEPDIQIKIQELNQKDAMLEEQRRIIVEIEIKLEEKQKQLESLRQQLEATRATVARHEAEQAALSERLRESEEKRGKACKIVQSLMTSNHQMSNQLREAKERSSKAEWEARQNPPDDLGEMTSDETERLWTELEQQRKQVERLSKENSAVLKEKAATEQALRQELADARLMLDRAGRLSCGTGIAGGDIVDGTAKLMFGRLDELAAFLAALLQRPHLLTGLSPAHRASLLHAVQKSWGTARQRYSLSLSLTMQQPDESVASDLDVEAARERTVEMWPVSLSSDLVAGKEMELINWETPRHEEEEEEGEDGGGATAVEREPPGSHNQSESEVWSEPDRSVSQARIGLPESCTPVAPPERTALVSPASSEADLITRTPGKKASIKRLSSRLRDSEQINEALRAELGAYQAMVKHSSPASVHNSPEGDDLVRLREVQINLETSRAKVVQLEAELASTTEHCQSLEAQLLKKEQGHIQALSQVQETLDSLHARELKLQQEVEEARAKCQDLEQQAHSSSEQCQQLEEAAIRDCELRKQLVQQLHQVKSERDQLQSHLEDMAAQKPVLADCSVQTIEKEHPSFANSTGPSSLIHLSDCDDVFQTDTSHIAEQMAGAVAQRNVDADTHRHTLSSPDLGIESDTGRMSSMEVPPSPPADPHNENWRLKQQLAKSQQLMEACLAALCRRNKDRRQVENSMKQQLKRTEEVLTLARANLRSLGPQCSSPSIELPSPVQH